MDIDFFRQLAEILPEQAAVLATVIEARGSTPREAGAKLLCWGQGLMTGTIGGGAGEAKVLQQAIAVLAAGYPQTVTIDLSGQVGAIGTTEGICGGRLVVWLQRWSGPQALALAQTIGDRLAQGQPVTLVTPLTPAEQPYLAAPGSPSPPGAWIETLQPPPALLIVGAGHCGVELAKAAVLAGFQVLVQDDRPEWAHPRRYPEAVTLFPQAIAPTLESLADHPQLHVALVTRSFQHDLAALVRLLQRPVPCAYIGAIGSRRRVQQVFQALAQSGIPAAKLAAVHAPIGLDIGALTPGEIAISIAAELILVRRGGTGRSLSRENRP